MQLLTAIATIVGLIAASIDIGRLVVRLWQRRRVTAESAAGSNAVPETSPPGAPRPAARTSAAPTKPPAAPASYPPRSAAPAANVVASAWQPRPPAHAAAPGDSLVEVEVSATRRWVGPWLWTLVQTLVVGNAVMVVADFQGWVDRLDPQHAPHNIDQWANLTTNSAVYAAVAAWISARLALGRVMLHDQQGTYEGPTLMTRHLRGRLYAVYAVVDVAAAAAVTVVQYRTIGPNIIDQFDQSGHWWMVYGLAVIGALVAFVIFLVVMNWWFDR